MMKAIEKMGLMDSVGAFTVMTADVPTQGVYLTLVLKDRMPFDMEVNGNIDAARKAHSKMIATAQVVEAFLEANPDITAQEIQELAPPVPRHLLN